MIGRSLTNEVLGDALPVSAFSRLIRLFQPPAF